MQCFWLFLCWAAAAAALMECWFRLKGHSCAASNSSCQLIYLPFAHPCLFLFWQHFSWQKSLDKGHARVPDISTPVKELCDKLHVTTNMWQKFWPRETNCSCNINSCLNVSSDQKSNSTHFVISGFGWTVNLITSKVIRLCRHLSVTNRL